MDGGQQAGTEVLVENTPVHRHVDPPTADTGDDPAVEGRTGLLRAATPEGAILPPAQPRYRAGGRG
jgi:hypothetical protein